MKKHLDIIAPTAFLVLVIVVVLLQDSERVLTCNPAATVYPSTFVVTAFAIEEQALLERVQVVDTCELGDTRYHTVTFANESFVTYMSGMGPEAAAATTKQTFDTFRVRTLIFSGIAGAVDEALAVGSTTVATTWYSTTGAPPVTIDATLFAGALASTTATTVPAGITAGEFVTDTSTLPDGMDIVDMETHTIATLAAEEGVPFIAFRTVSDRADGTHTEDDLKRAAVESARATLQFLENYE